MAKTWRQVWDDPPAEAIKIDGNVVGDLTQLMSRPPGLYLIRGPILKQWIWFIPITIVDFFAIYVGPEGKCGMVSEISRPTDKRVVVSSSAAAKAELCRRLGIV